MKVLTTGFWKTGICYNEFTSQLIGLKELYNGHSLTWQILITARKSKKYMSENRLPKFDIHIIYTK